MLQCKITFSSNTGVAIQFGDINILVDFFHNKKIPGFSTITDVLCGNILNFLKVCNPTVVFYTHCHPDHYSRQFTQIIKEEYQNVKLILTAPDFDNQMLLYKDEHIFSMGDLCMRFKRLSHEGKEFEDVPNYGCIMNYGNFRILIVGDCSVGNPELISFINGGTIDAVFFPFPWVALKKGRAFIESYIKYKHMFVYHLPFKEDDINGYIKATHKSIFDNDLDVCVLEEPLQTEIIEF